MNKAEDNDDARLRERVSQLTSKLQSEVSRINLAHQADLELLAIDCGNAVKELKDVFDQRLQEAEKKHRENILSIEEKIAYLSELSDSQHLMLQNSMEYIRELEKPFVTKPTTPEL